jgi:uncharacterized protein
MKHSEKYDILLDWFRKYPRVAIAFSGGVDSTFLLAFAHKACHGEVIAITVKTPYIPDWEAAEAVAFCSEYKINHKVITGDMIPEILNNPVNRCYLCKRHLFGILRNIADEQGFVTVIDGTNADDTGVYRPGLTALKELGIKSPLLESGITKAEIREMAAQMGLSVAQKPSYACLLTRLPYNYKVNTVELQQIEKAERYLASLGYANSRVRSYGDMARIELEKERIIEFMHSEKSGPLTAFFHQLGYRHVSIDLEGYRSGSFDKTINISQHEPGISE